MKGIHLFYAAGLLLLLSSFTPMDNPDKKMPKGAKVIQNFEVDRYMGKWFEIARLDFRFEKHMQETTAQYRLLDNGKVEVINAGYHVKKKKWKSVKGKAKFRAEKNLGALSVSFFGPFYSPYNIIALDDEYKHVLVCGKNLDYLWILSRTPQIPEEIKNKYVEIAAGLGYAIDELVWVEHGKHPNNTDPSE